MNDVPVAESYLLNPFIMNPQVNSEATVETKPNPQELTSTEKLLKANTPVTFGLVICGFLGEGKSVNEIVGAVVDATVPDSKLPDGVSRDAVKNGLTSMFGEFTKFLFER